MHLIHIAMVGMAWLLAVVWLGKLIEAARGMALVPKLWAAKYDVVPVGEPSIVVVVPARNEGPHVAACLNSLLAQDYGRLRVIAVDDRSTDETGAIMDALAEQSDGRLRALHVESLPPDWLGKTHAMAMAAQGVMAEFSPDYLLFTDADVVFEAEAVRRSLVYAVSSGADHLVVVPTTETRTWGERMMLSYLQVMSLWAVRWWKVPDPRAKRDAIGVGAFNLVRTEAYLQLGGFESVRMEILEDLTFGRRVKAAGLRQRVAMAPGMVSVHWAAGVQGIIRGMTKNVFAVFHFQIAMLLAAAVGMLLQCVGPVGLLAFEGARIPAVISLAAALGLYLLSSRTSRISPAYGLFLPVAAILVVYAMVRSMAVTVIRGGVTWRGTFYPLAELRRADSAGRLN